MSDALNRLLERVDNPRKDGNGWRARCPAHDGQSRSTLRISEGDDNRVLLHCFAGCSPLEIVHSVGLELKDLFERPNETNLTPEERRRIRTLAIQGQWKAALKSLPLEIAVIQIAAVKLAKGEPLDRADHMRLELAAERVRSAEAVLCG